MNEDLAKLIADLEIMMRAYSKIPKERREIADIAISYRISQVEKIDETVATQYRSRYIELTGGYK